MFLRRRTSVRRRSVVAVGLAIGVAVMLMVGMVAVVSNASMQTQRENELRASTNSGLRSLELVISLAQSKTDLWFSSAYAHDIIDNTQLTAAFFSFLRDHFRAARAQYPWVSNFAILGPEGLIYIDRVYSGMKDAEPVAHPVTQMLAALPLTVSTVRMPGAAELSLLIKRPLLHDGVDFEGYYSILFIDPVDLGIFLFSDQAIGKSGFIGLFLEAEGGMHFVSGHGRKWASAAFTELSHEVDSGPGIGVMSVRDLENVTVGMRRFGTSSIGVAGVAVHRDLWIPLLRTILVLVGIGVVFTGLGLVFVLVTTSRRNVNKT